MRPGSAFSYPSLPHDQNDIVVRVARYLFVRFVSFSRHMSPTTDLRSFIASFGLLFCIPCTLLLFLFSLRPKTKNSKVGFWNRISHFSFSKWWGLRAVRAGWTQLRVRRIFVPTTPFDPASAVAERKKTPASPPGESRVIPLPYVIPKRKLCRVGAFAYGALTLAYAFVGIFFLADLVLFLTTALANDELESLWAVLCPEPRKKKYDLQPYVFVLGLVCAMRSVRIVVEVFLQVLLTGGNALKLEPISMTPQIEGEFRPHEWEMCVRLAVDVSHWWICCWLGLESLCFCFAMWETVCAVLWCLARTIGLFVMREPPEGSSNAKKKETDDTLQDIVLKISRNAETLLRKAYGVGALIIMGVWIVLYGRQPGGDSWGIRAIAESVAAGSCGSLRSFWVVGAVLGKGLFDVYGERLFRNPARERKKLEDALKALKQLRRKKRKQADRTAATKPSSMVEEVDD